MQHWADSEAIVWFVLCHGRGSSPTVDTGPPHLRNNHLYTRAGTGEVFRLDYLSLALELAYKS